MREFRFVLLFSLLLLFTGCIAFEPLQRDPHDEFVDRLSPGERPNDVSTVDLSVPNVVTVTRPSGQQEAIPLPAPRGDSVEFVQKLRDLAPVAEGAQLQGQILSVETKAGTVICPLPPIAPPETAGAYFIRKAAEGAGKSLETGSPAPAAIGIVEGALGLLTTVAGVYALRKRKDAKASDEKAAALTQRAEQRETIATSVITGIRDAQASPEAKRQIDETIQSVAKQAGIESGPDGLKALVLKLGANVNTKQPATLES